MGRAGTSSIEGTVLLPPSAPGLLSPTEQPPLGQAPSTRVYLHAVPKHMGEVPSAQLPKTFFYLQPGPWLHYSKADHEHSSQTFKEWVAGEVAEPISAVRTLTSITV